MTDNDITENSILDQLRPRFILTKSPISQNRVRKNANRREETRGGVDLKWSTCNTVKRIEVAKTEITLGKWTVRPLNALERWNNSTMR